MWTESLPLPPLNAVFVLASLFSVQAHLPPDVWDSFVDATSRSAWWHLSVAYLAGLIAFWVMALFFNVLDVLQWPAVLYQYKIQPAITVSLQKRVQSMLYVLGIQLFTGVPFMMVVGVVAERLAIPQHSPLPSPAEFFWQLPVLLVVEEIGFFYSHRLFHVGSLYRLIHKRHHEFTAPVAHAAMYAHPLENIVANLLPLAVGGLLLRSHVWIWLVWHVLAVVNTCYSHSGYSFPLFHSSNFHDLHHEQTTVNFGVLEILDRVHGSYLDPFAFKEQQRAQLAQNNKDGAAQSASGGIAAENKNEEAACQDAGSKDAGMSVVSFCVPALLAVYACVTLSWVV
eukprot:gnl/Spiro4/28270_TR13980_c0_g1_i1.p1 gnl/Spiro4/28270_TR13980_c0_g1~~gnl/Spiro4/28270_TR13980_c0_g1_i1.p1  ORF type:complete len:340 (+),score=107.99 gnl/Spiro4/28270_TR13980_c0_g1_i1:138-1157(+)